MDGLLFVIEVLADWVVTGQDFETVLDNALADAQVQGEERVRLADRARRDFRHLQKADLNELRRLRGNRGKLTDEIAAILRW